MKNIILKKDYSLAHIAVFVWLFLMWGYGKIPTLWLLIAVLAVLAIGKVTE